jgi:hypothetical protein
MSIFIAHFISFSAEALRQDGEELEEYIMTFANKFDLPAAKLVQCALGYKKVIQSVQKVQSHILESNTQEIGDLYALRSRYDVPRRLFRSNQVQTKSPRKKS